MQFGADDGCLIVCSSVMTSDVLMCAVRCRRWMSYCVQFGANDGCITIFSSVLSSNVILCAVRRRQRISVVQFGADDGCPIVCNS